MIVIEHDKSMILRMFKNSEEVTVPKFSKRTTLIAQFYEIA